MKEKTVVCFGEVLWDVLPTGKVPGGAPMNVAYHLQKHLIKTSIVTRIGNDDMGTDLRRWFAEKGMDTGYFQIDTVNTTGKVYATPDDHGNMHYEIVKPVAWDFISYDEAIVSLVKQADLFVYGSLSSRSIVTRDTLYSLLEHASKKIMDVNLRPPHFTKQVLLELMTKADVLKLNEDELKLVSDWMPGKLDRKENIRRISERFNINTVIVTRGAAGAIVYENDCYYEHPGYTVQVADTVGSGDAFLAGFIVKSIEEDGIGEALEYAARLGAFVASKKGGCPVYDVSEISRVAVRNAW